MIRSSKVTIKFANTGKLVKLEEFREEYQAVTQELVTRLWSLDVVPKLIPNTTYFSINSWLSARAIQAAGKQASAIVRGTKRKNRQRDFVLKEAIKAGRMRDAKLIQDTIDKNPTGLPSIKNIDPQLDARFVRLEFGGGGSFDGWISLTSLGNGIKIVLPIKRTRHMNRLEVTGSRLSGVRVGKYGLSFSYKIQTPSIKSEGSVLGVDIGVSTLLSCSDDQVSTKDNHGWDIHKIMLKLTRRVRGSRGFKKAQQHRKNYIGWAVNRLSLDNKKQINLEDIKGLRINRVTSKLLQRWNYADIFRKLKSKAEELGVQVVLQNPRYTSQRCSGCGWVQKANRVSKAFKCKSCGFSLDADLNAARNLGACLRRLKPAECRKGSSQKGFYWNPDGWEPIVPDTLKNKQC